MLIVAIIHAEGDFVSVRHLPDGKMSLAEKQAAVGGLVQFVPDFDEYAGLPSIVFCDEEGILKNKPLNRHATNEWRRFLDKTAGPDGYLKDMAVLFGDVLVVSAETHAELEDI